MHIMDMSSLFSGHGFGINTDIFETNVLNLAVVIAVVISFVGDLLRDLLDTRKQKILDNISLADARAREMEERIQTAKTQLSEAEQRVMDIREQGRLTAEREKTLCIAQAETEAERLYQLKDDSVRLQQQKAIQRISQQIVRLSVEHAHGFLETDLQKRPSQLLVNRDRMLHYVAITKEQARLNQIPVVF